MKQKASCSSRASRLRRKPVSQSIVIGEKETKLLSGLYHFGPLASKQVQRWLYSDAKYCAKRLRILFDNGFLNRQEQVTKLSEGSKPLIHSISTVGLGKLVELDIIKDVSEYSKSFNQISHYSLAHHMQTNDVLISALLSADALKMHLQDFKNDVNLRSGSLVAQGVTIPDLYLHFYQQEQDQLRLFCEVDRGFQGRTIIQNKLNNYLAYSRTTDYRQQFGLSENEMLPLLFVVQSSARMNSLIRFLLDTPGKEVSIFSTLEKVRTQNFFTDPIWNPIILPSKSRSLLEFYS